MKPVSKDIETGFIFYSRILRSLVYVGMESRRGYSAYRLRRESDARNRDRNLRVGMNHTYGYRDTSSYKGTGNDVINDRIAAKRAAAVVWMLTKKYNIPSERITEKSKGARVQPFAENAENRVTIMIAK